MSKFKKNNATSEDIPTSALPDIIFMLLFFFMVTTVLREQEVLLKNSLPDATQLQKLEKKSLISHLYLGEPKDVEKYGTASRIQADDVLIKPREVIQFISQKRDKLPEVEKNKMIVSLKVDEETDMGIVIDVRQQLRKANALKVNYASLKEVERTH